MEFNVVFYDARQIIQFVDSDGRTFIIIVIIIIIHEVALFNREMTTNCIKTAAVCA